MKPAGHQAPKNGLLLTECWCGRGRRWVPAAEVRAGRTLPCRRLDCAPPDAEGRLDCASPKALA